MNDIEQLRYPIGRLNLPSNIKSTDVQKWISEIEILPTQISNATQNLSEEQLNTAYRPDGWTLRQFVHHVADSHINSYVRFKWTLTEEKPTIKAYNEAAWAELPEAKNAPIEVSLSLLKALHYRWVMMLKNLSSSDLKRTFTHPETGESMTLEALVGLYAWHG
jgi:uncharacterized damage-inducible protein DinB